MYSKLAFSITAILETDIMLIDEVLSVGDQKFKKKSYNKMKSLISNKDRTVVIVSHSIDTLKQLCDTVMWMHEGQIKKNRGNQGLYLTNTLNLWKKAEKPKIRSLLCSLRIFFYSVLFLIFQKYLFANNLQNRVSLSH